MKTRKKKSKPTLVISSKPKKQVYEPRMLITIYRLAKEGYNNREIADIMGVLPNTFNDWAAHREEVKDALLQGRSDEKVKADSVMEDAYLRLPDHLKPVWDEIMAVDRGAPVERLERMMEECGRRGRQNLFLYALMHSNYQVTAARRLCKVRKPEMTKWMQDPQFAELMDEICVNQKKDFFESALIELVRNGHPGAVLFANKTVNADRGYAPTKKVHHKHDHSGEVLQGHAVVDVSQLPLEERVKVLEALRAGKTKALTSSTKDD